MVITIPFKEFIVTLYYNIFIRFMVITKNFYAVFSKLKLCIESFIFETYLFVII